MNAMEHEKDEDDANNVDDEEEEGSEEYSGSESSEGSDEDEESDDGDDDEDEEDEEDEEDGSGTSEDEEDSDGGDSNKDEENIDEKDEKETKITNTEKKIPDASDPESVLCRSSPAGQELTMSRKREQQLSASPKGVTLSSSIPIEPRSLDQQQQHQSGSALASLASSGSTKKSSTSGSSGPSASLLSQSQPPLPQSLQLSSSSSSSSSSVPSTAPIPVSQSTSTAPANSVPQKISVSKQANLPIITGSSNGGGRKGSLRSSSVPAEADPTATNTTKRSQKQPAQQASAAEPEKVPEDPDLPKPGGQCSHILEQLVNEKPIFQETIKCSPAEVFRRFLTGSSSFYNDVYEEYKYTEIQSTPWTNSEEGSCGCKTREWSFHMIMSHKLAGTKPTTMRHVQTCVMQTNGTILLQQVSFMGKEVPYGDSFRPHALLRIAPKNEDGCVSSEVTIFIKIVFLKSLMFKALIEKSAFGEMSEFFVNLTKKMKAQVEADPAGSSSSSSSSSSLSSASTKAQGHSRKDRKKESKAASSSKSKKKGKRSKKNDSSYDDSDSSSKGSESGSSGSTVTNVSDNLCPNNVNVDSGKNFASAALAIIVKVLLMPLQLPVIFQGALTSVIISFVISNFVMYPTKTRLDEQARQIQLLSDNVALLKSYCIPPLQQQQQQQQYQYSSSSSPYYRVQQGQRQDYGMNQYQDSMYEDGECLIDASGESVCNAGDSTGNPAEGSRQAEKNGGMEEVLDKLSQMNDLISLLAKNMQSERNFDTVENIVITEKKSFIAGHGYLYSTIGLILSILILFIMKHHVL